jgi:hypothetical protein
MQESGLEAMCSIIPIKQPELGDLVRSRQCIQRPHKTNLTSQPPVSGSEQLVTGCPICKCQQYFPVSSGDPNLLCAV